MSWFGDFFSPSQDTNQTTTTTQSSSFNNQANSQNNLWPYLQPYFQNYATAAFNPAPFNANQTGAANSQGSVSGNLTPAFGSASTIASGGLSPTAYQPYMSQYTQSVVDPTVAEFERLNKSTTADINGSLAKSGALGNSNNNQTRAAALAPILNNQKAQIAGLYNAGYNNATNTALQSQQQQLGASSTLGSLTGAATGANQANFNIGQTLWQNPLQWMTQGASGLSNFLQGAGTNQSSSGNQTGTSTGTTSGTTTTNPSTFQDIAGIAGLVTSFIPKGKADGGAVHGYDAGGVVPMMPQFRSVDLPEKVSHAFDALHGLRERARGGAIPRFDNGGSVGGSWAPTITTYGPSSTMGDDLVDKVNSEQPSGIDYSKVGKAFTDAANTSDYSKDMAAANAASSAALANQSNQLSAFMQNGQRGMPTSQPATQGYASGGVPSFDDNGIVGFDGGSGDALSNTMPSYVGASAPSSTTTPSTTQASAPQASASSGWSMPSFIAPIVNGIKASPMVTGDWTTGTGPLARSLLAASGPHIGAPIAQQASEIIKERLAQQNADRLHQQMVAQMTGQYNGQPTLDARRAESAINLQNAQTEVAKVAADKEYQLSLEKQKMEYAKDLAAAQALQKQEADINAAEAFRTISPETAERMREAARRVYQQSRSNNNEARTTPATPPATLPPNSTGTWTPNTGVQN